MRVATQILKKAEPRKWTLAKGPWAVVFEESCSFRMAVKSWFLDFLSSQRARMTRRRRSIVVSAQLSFAAISTLV